MMLPEIIGRYRNEIEAELACVLASFQLPFYDMLRYHLGWIDDHGRPATGMNGKALRSTLCLMACEAVSGEFRKALPAAAALELVHNFSLIHDDIQDDDRERRHRPTVWVVYGKPQAMNAGTAMRVLANVSLMRLSSQGVPAELLLDALELLDQSSLRLIEGQHLDLSFEKRVDIGVQEYLQMIKLKTVTLISSALALGAMLVMDDPEGIQPFINYGENLGFAFQIQDDILGIWGETKNTGKPVGNDILRKKKSYPIVFALERASANDRKELENLYRQDTIEEIERQQIMEILERSAARKNAQDLVDQFSRKAVMEIERAPISPSARRPFHQMMEFLDVREF